MRKLLLTAAVAALTLSASAQQFKVTKVEPVSAKGAYGLFHPVFTPDGKSLLVSGEAFDGLGIVNLETKTYKRLSDAPGAGYKVAMSQDCKTVVSRSNNNETMRMSLYQIDVATAKQTLIAADIEHVNNVSIKNQTATYAINGKLRGSAIASLKPRGFEEATLAATYVTEEDLKMVVYRNGVRTVVDPILKMTGKDLNYCWTSLSPNGKKLLFTCHDATYVSNLDGSGLVKLGAIQAPVWRGNDYVVGMNDQHDGYFYTSSDIVIIGVDGKNFQQLSTPSSEIKMFPSVSPDGSKIAFHTTDGKIYMMSITKK